MIKKVDFLKWTMWLPGLFWLFPFLVFSLLLDEKEPPSNSISIIHGIWSGIQIGVLIAIL